MGDTTTIEWTDRTWNPVTGCTQISAGCDNCYAKTIAERFRGTAAFPNGFDVQVRGDKFRDPLSWRKPAKVFVNSMSDLFHDQVSTADLHLLFGVMAATPQHTYQILTKRHGRMRSLLADPHFAHMARHRAEKVYGLAATAPWTWPLPNVWLGVSVENQQWADIRIPALLDTPAAVRWISAEPLLGPIDLTNVDSLNVLRGDSTGHENGLHWVDGPTLNWVVAGGESGHGARPAHPDWFRTLRDQTAAAHVPFLFKQWGSYVPTDYLVIGGPREKGNVAVGEPVDDLGHRVEMRHTTKKAAGRDLDGRMHDDYPGGQ